jgi:hypothetical protein
MTTSVTEILDLVGPLDDTLGEQSPRERFRRHLSRSIQQVGQIRDYVDECLRTPGPQYHRALQDLVNHVGHFLGFEVSFGRYQGAVGHPGFDGHWTSPTGIHVVVEVKTTEVYSVKTVTLVGYVEELICEGIIPNWEKALGLYVIGRPDPDIRQLQDSITAQKRTDQLRIISVDSLLSLAEIMEQYGVTHDDALSVLQPSGPMIDPVIELMADLVGQRAEATPARVRELPSHYDEQAEVTHWLTPVKSHPDETAEECIAKLVGRERIYAFGDRTPGRKRIKLGDYLCFYATQNGVVAHARVASLPERRPHPKVVQPDKYPWVFRLESEKLYLSDPIVIDSALRQHLDAFEGRDPDQPWAWFVQWTKEITKHDFDILTRQSTSNPPPNPAST